MEMKINRDVFLKVFALLLCFYLAIAPFFQTKKVCANPAVAVVVPAIGFVACAAAWRWVDKTIFTPEQLNQLNDKATTSLQEAFPDPIEYNKQLGILENLSNDLLAGKDIDWSKYSGKAIYAISKAVIDVLYPNHTEPIVNEESGHYKGVWLYMAGGQYCIYDLYSNDANTFTRIKPLKPTLSVYGDSPKYDTAEFGKVSDYITNTSPYRDANVNLYFRIYNADGTRYITPENKYAEFFADGYGAGFVVNGASVLCVQGDTSFWKQFFFGGLNTYYVPSIAAKIANKVKLPTRLPPSVINNYNTYINGESENLVIDPTDDELPQLPDNYNPVTDDPPDLDGFQDVTPDQNPTDTPEPTPSPDYDGSSWIKPIGDFFAGLLSFLKDALIPTQTVDFSPLQNMSTDFGSKFPFSLPGDIGKLFGVLQAEPRRPEFQMTFDLSKVGVPGDPIVWDLNFEQWDDAAAIVKTALYIGFLIGLVFISKNFMKN